MWLLSCLTLSSFHNEATSVTTYLLWIMVHVSRAGIRLQNFRVKICSFVFYLFLHKLFPIFCLPISSVPHLLQKKSCGFFILKSLWWLSHIKNCWSRKILHDVGNIVFLNLFRLCSYFCTWLFMVALQRPIRNFSIFLDKAT